MLLNSVARLLARAPMAARVSSGRINFLGAAAVGCLALAACSTQPRPEPTYLLDDIDAQRKLPDADWNALRTQLPPVPTEADTLPIETLERNEHFRFGIDPRSIQVAPGLIVRYSLRSVSDRGAENISYESVRCGTREWRVVALNRPGDGWQRPTQDQWQPAVRGTIQQMLLGGVFCSGGGPASPKPADLAYRLRHWDQYADGLTAQNIP